MDMDSKKTISTLDRELLQSIDAVISRYQQIRDQVASGEFDDIEVFDALYDEIEYDEIKKLNEVALRWFNVTHYRGKPVVDTKQTDELLES